MPRRIEIELTSARPDGTWTWRAAGAREPRGVVDGGLLPGEAKPGDVLKAEAEFELEGITIVSVVVPKAENRPEPQRIEVLGPSRPPPPGVTTQLAGRRPPEHRRDREDREGRPPRRGEGRRPDSPRPERSEREARPARPRQERNSKSSGEAEAAQPTDQRDERRRPEGGRQRTGEGGRQRSRERTPERAGDRHKNRFNPASTHRRAALESLPPEQQPVAEQLLRGGIPAVRTALHLEREKAFAEGRPAPNSDELIALAESILPRLRTAEWRDRAEAAAGDVDNVPLRDLRSVVASSDLARDEDTRTLAATLQTALEQRLQKLHQGWSDDISAQLDAGRVVRALRLSGRPPDPSTRLDAGLAQRLAETAGSAMSPETGPDLWLSLLEAAAGSPVRRAVSPTGLPENATPELKKAAHQNSGAIPALAKLLGVAIPPPPPPVSSRQRTGPATPRRPRPSAPPRQQRPPRKPAEATAPAPTEDHTEGTASVEIETDAHTPEPGEAAAQSVEAEVEAHTAEKPGADESPDDNSDNPTDGDEANAV